MASWGHGSKSGSSSSEQIPRVTIDSTGNLAVRSITMSDRFDFKAKLGSGTYGTVIRAHDAELNRMVALKKMEFEVEKGVPLHVVREMNIIKALDHPNVIKCLACHLEMGTFWLVLECMEMDLSSYISDTKYSITMDIVKQFAYQLLAGVNHCHAQRIMHRDLKPQNVLINVTTRALKISDFGLSRYMQTILRAYSPEVVTLYYRAPELLMGCRIYSAAIDLWSVGCIVAEMILRVPIFQATTVFETLDLIFRTLGTPDDIDWPGFSTLLKNTEFRKYPKKTLLHMMPVLVDDLACTELITRLLQCCPDTRITAADALAHQVFSGEFGFSI